MAVGALVGGAVLQAFVAPRPLSFPTARSLRPSSAIAQAAQVIQGAGDEWDLWNQDVNGGTDLTEDMQNSAFIPQGRVKDSLERDVKVTDIRDVNELLRLPNPLKPTLEIRLAALTLDDGTRIERPSVQNLRRLQPSSIRPVVFHWKDSTRTQTKAPKQYDEFIQRLLNSSPSDMEDLVRANWRQFDKGFFFRLTELKEDTTDERLREKVKNLENMAYDIVAAAQKQMRKSLPEHAKDAREIMNAMLEIDGDTLLWPPPPEAFTRLAAAVELRATRAKYDDGWFETIVEISERFGTKMQVQDKKALFGMAQVVMQRVVTEWLRHDSLWEETSEGQFIYRLMCLSHEQWPQQLMLEKAPLDIMKLLDELKIVSENKVVALPMGSKLQVYAAKYLQGMREFIEMKDKILEQAGVQAR